MIVYIGEKQYSSKVIRVIRSTGKKVLNGADKIAEKANEKFIGSLPNGMRSRFTKDSRTILNNPVKKNSGKFKEAMGEAKKIIKEGAKDSYNSAKKAIKDEVQLIKDIPTGQYIKARGTDTLVGIGHGIQNAGRAIKTAAADPGIVSDKVIRSTLANPVTAVSQVAGKIGMASGNPVLMATPIGGIGAAGEALAGKIFPQYKAVTEGLAKKYEGATKLRTKIKDVTNGVVSGVRNIAMTV